jgi:DNA polymerase-3 subunit alpha
MGQGQDIPVGPGRGSGAGSLVAYALTITDLDPCAIRCCSNGS